MKSNRLTVQVIRPIAEVFAFTIEPKNVPKWLDYVVAGDRNDWQLKAGSVYRLKYKDGKVIDFDVTASEVNKLFEIVSRDGNYHVRYSFKPVNSYKTELEYFEWVEEGDIEAPFTKSTLNKLRMAIEFKTSK